MELKVSNATLIVFVDDTGHEALVPGQPVFGLGGCAVMAADLDRIIRIPWHDVRRRVRGSPENPLHAANLGHPPRPEDIETVAQFFKEQPFARIGATITIRAQQAAGLSAIDTIAAVLKNRILDIAKWTPFEELNVIFEASDRADRQIETAFADFRVEENGRSIPVECFFMPKSVQDPALEVADFIMHAVGRQARRRMGGRTGFAPDFAAVFHGQDSRRVSYMEVERV